MQERLGCPDRWPNGPGCRQAGHTPHPVGHDAAHVRDLELATAPDHVIVDNAVDDDRAIVSADTDFGALLAARRATRPSLLLVGEIVELPPAELARRIDAQHSSLEPYLHTGAIVAFTPEGVRVRSLPIP